MAGNINGDGYCIAIPCEEKATHTLTTKVSATDNFPEFEQSNGYCLEHAVYFAGWLPYCYPGEYEVVGITPPAKDLFKTA